MYSSSSLMSATSPWMPLKSLASLINNVLSLSMRRDIAVSAILPTSSYPIITNIISSKFGSNIDCSWNCEFVDLEIGSSPTPSDCHYLQLVLVILAVNLGFGSLILVGVECTSRFGSKVNMTKSTVQNEQLSFILGFPLVELFNLQPIYMYYVMLYSNGNCEKLQFASHVE